MALLLVAGFLLAGPASDALAHRGRCSPEMKRGKRMANHERVDRGTRKLRFDHRLNRLAKRQSRRMASQNRLHHNPNLAYEARNIPWSILGENVGVGNTVESLHRAFMNSSGHRRNVLNGRYRRIGVGVVHAQGRTWITYLFAG
jgi:uncharacterized protein YkwD